MNCKQENWNEFNFYVYGDKKVHSNLCENKSAVNTPVETEMTHCL